MSKVGMFVAGLLLSAAVCGAPALAQRKVGEQSTENETGEPSGKSEVNNSGRYSGDPGKRTAKTSVIGDNEKPKTPTTPVARAPAVVTAPGDDIASDLVTAYENLKQPYTPEQRTSMGIGSASEHISVKVADLVGVVIQVADFYVGAEFAKNAYAQQERYRIGLPVDQTGYLLLSHEGGGQVKTLPVKSLDDKPLNWDPSKMVIIQVTGLDADSKALRDTMYSGLQARYEELERARTKPVQQAPVSKPTPTPTPRKCTSSKSCGFNPQ